MGSRSSIQSIPPQFHLELFEAPGAFYHGDSAYLRLVGWIATEPQVREVQFKLSDEEVVGRCDIARPDVLAQYQVFSNELCGFDIRADLGFLRPGMYQVACLAPDTSILAENLGRIHVLPKCEFQVQRLFVPDSIACLRPFPISLEGIFQSSCTLHGIELHWNSQKTEIQPDFAESESEGNGLLTYQISLFDEIMLSDSRSQYKLELIFLTQDGEIHRWQHRGTLRIADVPHHTLSLREIGDYDPSTDRVPIHLSAMVHPESTEDDILLMRDQEPLLTESLSGFPVRNSLVCFELREELPNLPPGGWNLSLALRRQSDGAIQTLTSWRQHVKMVEPRVFVEHFKVRPVPLRASGYTVGLVGWVDHHLALEELFLKIGDEQSELSLDQLRPDVAEHLGQRLVRRQGLHTDIVLEIPPGHHLAQILFNQSGEQRVAWEKSVRFEPRTAPDLLISSEELADLADGKHCGFWSSILIEGEVISKLDGISAVLFVDGEKADQAAITSDGRFALRHAPETTGCYQIRVKLSSSDQTIFDSKDRYVSFEKFDLPKGAPANVHRFIRHIGLKALFRKRKSPDLIRELFRSDRGLMSDYLEMLQSVGEALTISDGREDMPEILNPLDYRPKGKNKDRPLKVLFVSWEIPYPRHGGGVWLTNILKHLATRHEITLIHSYGLDEEKWVEEVQQYVPRVISIPRAARAPSVPRHNRALSSLYDDYLPDLLTAVQLEAEVGNYDIVNYDYIKLYPHATTVDIPEAMIVHEERLAARLANGPEEPPTEANKVKHLDGLLKDFFFSAVVLPRRFRHLVALTEEDAGTLSGYQESSAVHVNHIGVDTEGLSRPEKVPATEIESPTLVFLGNYKHPPNVAAVKYFADKVMPGVRKRCPQAKFVIVGSNVPAELEGREAENIFATGFVADFRPYIWEASAFVAPIFSGAGMRVKILEAMACGAPIVGTRLSMHGIAAKDGEHYFRAETKSQFVKAACRCVEKPKDARKVGQQGAELMARQYSYEISARERELIWYRVIDDWR